MTTVKNNIVDMKSCKLLRVMSGLDNSVSLSSETVAYMHDCGMCNNE